MSDTRRGFTIIEVMVAVLVIMALTVHGSDLARGA